MITIDFSKRKNCGLCQYLYKNIKKQILEGELCADEKLPSKRSLAQNLGISVITVQNAYAQLIDEGYIYSIEKKGFFVTNIKLENHFTEEKKLNSKNNFIKIEEKKYFTDFTSNATAVEKFPFNLWARLTRQVLQSCDEKLLERTQVKGVWAFREQIALYLKEFRNMNVSPHQIIVGAGTETLCSMLVQLLGRKKSYAVEDPGYHKVKKIFELNGASCIPIKIDSQGLDLNLLKKSCAKIIHISPSHHFPTGIVMPVKRRLELLEWAEKSKERFIIEDDYDSEFRFNGKPLSTLQSADKNDCVIYMNTFSKTLSPSFRISYMVLPEKLLKIFEEQLGFYSTTVSSLEQYTLALFMQKGFYAKHIIRMKNYYRSLRNDLIAALQKSPLHKISQIHEQEAGLHFLLTVKTKKSISLIKKELEKEKLRIALLQDFYYSRQNKNVFKSEKIFVINYSAVKKEKIAETVKRMEKVFLATDIK